MTTSPAASPDSDLARRPARADRRLLVATLARGAVAGMAAGMLFAAMTMWLVVSQGMPVKIPLLAIASIVQGQHAIGAGTASPLLGAVVHLMLSAAFGMVLAWLLRRARTDATAVLIGAGYGLALYVVNFVALGSAVFAVFTRLNQPFQVLNHLVYGVLVALFLLLWRPRQARSARS
ncbi:hypothetical protein ATK30_4910 [Amycolatopsis echigonensis]|uniref:Uncharacterized protein n=3 Tax=Pseudonocardiaceae TaxID=2070 RepID=A0A2N3WJJ2_9PSEU|nr:hypothetical protein [Amycolatopsis niigatensis]AEA23527.1 hypothetical protein Psed_1284 [Pseudonocardia dioxanivorans CB1190]PKV94041.1 hypothetical protein ATK30_4910 [Amycolatopsis niigatensis]